MKKSVMRGNFSARIVILRCRGGLGGLHLLPDKTQLLLQAVDLLLLPENKPIELVEQVFCQTQLRFDLLDTRIDIHISPFAIPARCPPENVAAR